ncbi:MAG: M14 family zinc carboxypeptidase [Planctomycetota bacterium]
MNAERFDDLIVFDGAAAKPEAVAVQIARSRDGTAIDGYRFGNGPRRVSLLAGCHADEPVGPRLLRALVSYLATLPSDDPLLHNYDWWIVPDINPDGARRNAAWQRPTAASYDIADYLSHVIRELPGDDIEFGFPRHRDDVAARPENLGVYQWWCSDPTPVQLHATLHGMMRGAGPWFLLEEGWAERSLPLQQQLSASVAEQGYQLHDVERHGEKGFQRISRGFCTRPDSRAMAQHFLALGDPATAALFRPSSMEAVRTLGGDPLTMVSEMPLFVTPGVGVDLGPPDVVADSWKARFDSWRQQLLTGTDPVRVRRAAGEAGLQAMPVRDQMRLQWQLVVSGLALVSEVA